MITAHTDVVGSLLRPVALLKARDGPSLSGQTGEALVVGVLIAAVAWLVGRDHLARYRQPF
jgi:hypothetical protein